MPEPPRPGHPMSLVVLLLGVGCGYVGQELLGRKLMRCGQRSCAEAAWMELKRCEQQSGVKAAQVKIIELQRVKLGRGCSDEVDVMTAAKWNLGHLGEEFLMKGEKMKMKMKSCEHRNFAEAARVKVEAM
ncbi:hypothetical protein NDU88_006980 [Pleurodeles waltl]|uniref:Uncharacterized protein n=1 Tax=Pleurodeles waltl TaxID=8319 RepID=A0AAV7N0U3_PLEWA|nr:hypothetical protein NDU88_006980 [Pleurodeles waltl]